MWKAGRKPVSLPEQPGHHFPCAPHCGEGNYFAKMLSGYSQNYMCLQTIPVCERWRLFGLHDYALKIVLFNETDLCKIVHMVFIPTSNHFLLQYPI